ncbi:hypothetical protein BDV33DRAFT_165464 [Aspergillus novoparasiticus]|uniref:Uncharacterized protein n=1 Tax=Aspergillus novoparasiticus TaxID=986946 RepID=A0A5N6F620_9EURO|nr:hypothetical protein BDV33DRAFT_165464 [Aspergillus novoparasiticus]
MLGTMVGWGAPPRILDVFTVSGNITRSTTQKLLAVKFISSFDFGEGQTPGLGQQLPITQDMGRKHGRIAIDIYDMEHVGGPHCQAYGGYLGHRISAPESCSEA